VAALARWCFRRRWIVLAVWLVALAGFTVAGRSAGTDFSTAFQLPDTPSTQATDLLEKNFPAASGDADQIVLHARSGTVRSPAVAAAARKMLAHVAALPHVQAVTSPYGPAGAAQISRDGTIAFATVHFDELGPVLPKAAVKRVISVAQGADSAQLQVELGGQAIENAEAQSSSRSTGLGVIFALIVLGLAFGALFAAFLPLITALVAIGIGFDVTGLLSHGFAVASFATILGVLIGLGVGVDYALFIVTRHRTGLKGGRTTEDAAVNAVNTAGRAVFFAGLTVCIALLGQFALGVSFLYGVAVSAAITVALTMLSSLTLLPALLGFFGTKVLSRRQRASLAATGPVAEAATGFWRRWAEAIRRHPVLPSLAALAAVVVIALPVFTLRLGLDDAGSDPSATTTHRAYELLATGFGPGFNGPLELVGQLHAKSDLPAFEAVVARVAKEPGVVGATPAVLSPNGTLAIASVYPSTSPEAAQTTVLLHRLRDQVIPAAQAGTGVTVLVGGVTATQNDFAHVLSSKLPLFIAVVVVLAFLLLMAVFRSLLIPAVASVMNLLSVGAALGIMNAVFEWGWGTSILGIAGDNPVEVFIPVLLFSILFGLSMDYEVFLVSRISEQWLVSRDNGDAVMLGQAETGRVITAAASIMILVFASFLLGGSIIIQQFGIGLAGAIIVDAFIVRTVLVPGLMHLIGRANWWLPGWLDRILPQLNVEAPAAPAAEPGQPRVTAPTR
jgi:putative drug exporter of the RND superfamily